MTGSQKNVSIFGTLFTCKFHGFWQHVSVNILWFILLILFEIAACCNLFGIAKDHRKKDTGIPYQRIPLLIILYHLQSTVFKACCCNPALWRTGSYKLTWKKNKNHHPFLSAFKEIPHMLQSIWHQRPWKEKGKLAEQMDWPFPPQLLWHQVQIDQILPLCTESPIFSLNVNKLREHPSIRTNYWQNREPKHTLFQVYKMRYSMPLLALYMEGFSGTCRNVTIDIKTSFLYYQVINKYFKWNSIRKEHPFFQSHRSIFSGC